MPWDEPLELSQLASEVQDEDGMEYQEQDVQDVQDVLEDVHPHDEEEGDDDELEVAYDEFWLEHDMVNEGVYVYKCLLECMVLDELVYEVQINGEVQKIHWYPGDGHNQLLYVNGDGLEQVGVEVVVVPWLRLVQRKQVLAHDVPLVQALHIQTQNVHQKHLVLKMLVL
jgi:hypothetical protein